MAQHGGSVVSVASVAGLQPAKGTGPVVQSRWQYAI